MALQRFSTVLCSVGVTVTEAEMGTGETEEHPETGTSTMTPADLVKSTEHQLCNEGAWAAVLGPSLNLQGS